MSTNEKTKILQMVKDGIITIDEAEMLLNVLDKEEAPKPADAIALKDKRGRKKSKLKVEVDASEYKGENDRQSAKINIAIPLNIIRVLGPAIANNIPKEAKDQLAAQGIDLLEIMNTIEEVLDSNLEEDIVNIDADTQGENAKVRIYVE